MTARNRRALLLGAGTVTAALLLLRGVPWAGRAALTWRARIVEQRETLTKEQTLLAGEARLKDSLGHALSNVVALAPQLAAVGSAAEASASLVSVVSLAANRHGLKVVRIDPLPDSTAGVFTRIAVHAELEGDIRGLVHMLHAVEMGDPLLTVVAMSVDAPAPTAPRNVSETLHITLTIAGYSMRKVA